jgi:NADPH-dependent F420 reductase
MNEKQIIVVIGASGNMGSAISKSLAKGNYKLLLCANEQDEVQAVIEEIKKTNSSADAELVDISGNANWKADVIIMAVPYEAEKDIVEKIGQAAKQKIVISIANPLNETYNGLVTAPDTSAAEELQKLLPDSKVIKAFNTTFAADFSTPIIDGKQADCFIAGNDEKALQTVSELVATAGFNPLIAGDLSVSRTLENMQLLLIQLGMKYNPNWLAGWKILYN